MKKTKCLLLLSLLLITYVGVMIPIVKADPSKIEYGNVTHILDRDADMVPQLSISVSYVLDCNSGLNLTDVTAANNHSYVIIDKSNDAVVMTGLMDYDSSDDSFDAVASLGAIPNGVYYFAMNFSRVSDGEWNYTEYLKSTGFQVSHTVKIQYTVTISPDMTSINIICTTNPTYALDPALDNTNAEVTYHIRKDSITVATGSLTYQSANLFTGQNINVKHGTGIYYVWITIDYDHVTGTISSENQINIPGHFFPRTAPLEDLLFYVIILAIVLGIILAIVFVYAKRGHGRVEKRKKTVVADKPLEVIEIDKTKTTKTQLGKSVQKEKGKTQANKDLIFSVPQWEEEELETQESKSDSPQTTISTTSSSTYSLHCPQCNSWVEIDEYIKAKCPNCENPLLLAVYCPKDQKWFDVPEKGDFKCPICSGPLKYTDK